MAVLNQNAPRFRSIIVRGHVVVVEFKHTGSFEFPVHLDDLKAVPLLVRGWKHFNRIPVISSAIRVTNSHICLACDTPLPNSVSCVKQQIPPRL